MKRIFACVLCIALLLTGCGVEIRHTGNDVTNGEEIVSGDKNVKTNWGGEVSDEDIGGVEYAGDKTDTDGSGMDIRLDNTSFDLDRPVDFKDLVNLTADELGILRNAVYARYGYIFKTKKYTDYFSGFDWYNPSLEDVNSKLTKTDKSNIALIQKVERFNEKNVKPGEEEKKLIGFWNCGAGVAAGYSNAYRFYEDGTYKFNNSQMVMDERNVAHAGKWFVLDGYLYLRMEREGMLVGGELVDAEHPGSATEKEIVGASYTVRPLDSFKTVVLRLDFDSNKIEKDYNSNGVVIGTLDFYKLSTGPDDIYDGLDV